MLLRLVSAKCIQRAIRAKVLTTRAESRSSVKNEQVDKQARSNLLVEHQKTLRDSVFYYVEVSEDGDCWLPPEDGNCSVCGCEQPHQNQARHQKCEDMFNKFRAYYDKQGCELLVNLDTVLGLLRQQKAEWPHMDSHIDAVMHEVETTKRDVTANVNCIIRDRKWNNVFSFCSIEDWLGTSQVAFGAAHTKWNLTYCKAPQEGWLLAERNLGAESGFVEEEEEEEDDGGWDKVQSNRNQKYMRNGGGGRRKSFGMGSVGTGGSCGCPSVDGYHRRKQISMRKLVDGHHLKFRAIVSH